MNIRKFTAVLSIAIISASSLSPVYADMREDKLNQREKNAHGTRTDSVRQICEP